MSKLTVRQVFNILNASPRCREYLALSVLHAIESAAFRIELDSGREPDYFDEDKASDERNTLWCTLNATEKDAVQRADEWIDDLQLTIPQMEQP